MTGLRGRLSLSIGGREYLDDQTSPPIMPSTAVATPGGTQGGDAGELHG
jgi:hypothetical protein